MDNEKFFTKLFDIEKNPVKLYFAITTFGTIIYFVQPKSIVTSKFYTDYEGIIYAVIFFFSAMLATTLVFAFFKFFGSFLTTRLYNYKRKKESLKILDNLNDYEQAILREFVYNHTSSVRMPADDATVNELVHKKVLTRPMVFLGRGQASYSITRYFIDLLDGKHIGIDTSLTDEELREFFHNNRPYWAED